MHTHVTRSPTIGVEKLSGVFMNDILIKMTSMLLYLPLRSQILNLVREIYFSTTGSNSKSEDHMIYQNHILVLIDHVTVVLHPSSTEVHSEVRIN